MMKREYIPFYRSFYEQICMCSDPEARLQMYEVLLDYAFNKREPDLEKGNYHEMTIFFWLGVRSILRKSWAQYENGCKGGAPKGNTNNKGKRKVNPKSTQSQANKDSDNENENDIERERECNTFLPPSLNEILNYYYSTHAPGTNADGIAKKFFNYYTARGWKMNGAPMADWRAAFDSWCDREQEFIDKHSVNYEKHNKQNDTEFEQQKECSDANDGSNGQSPSLDDSVW